MKESTYSILSVHESSITVHTSMQFYYTLVLEYTILYKFMDSICLLYTLSVYIHIYIQYIYMFNIVLAINRTDVLNMFLNNITICLT